MVFSRFSLNQRIPGEEPSESEEESEREAESLSLSAESGTPNGGFVVITG